MDSLHRQRLVETVWLFWVFVLIGFDNGILGPCLPDLQSSVGVSLQAMSYVFFLQGTGTVLGNVLGFLLEKRLDRRLLCGLYVLAGSVVDILIPLVPSYVYLLLLFLLQGVTKGLADFSAMSLCNVLWEQDKALPFQFIVVGAGISTFISPFIAQPFIDDSLSSLATSAKSSASSEPCPDQQHTTGNKTTQFLSSYSHSHLFPNPSERLSEFPTNPAIKWPFIIVGLTTVPAAVAFIYFYLTKPAWKDLNHTMEFTVSTQTLTDITDGRDTQTDRLLPNTQRSTKTPPARSVLIFQTLIVLLNIPVFGLLLTFADLLTSLGMSSPLCMTAVEASYFNTVLWGAAMIGRAVSASILICVPMYLQLLLCSVALVVVGIVLVASSPANVVALWFGTAGVGLFATPSMPGYIAWSGDYVPITPFFMNLCLCASGVGEILLPFVGGQLMATYGSWYMMMFSLTIMAVMAILFIAAGFVGKKIRYIE